MDDAPHVVPRRSGGGHAVARPRAVSRGFARAAAASRLRPRASRAISLAQGPFEDPARLADSIASALDELEVAQQPSSQL